MKQFIANDCNLSSDQRFWLLTGPNMGGKSTFLRQNAVIAILAQAGCFVPAQQAEIGIIDAVYTRIGASDDLSKDRSTFMVEMEETANIIKKSTSKSLVIMDEVGRGTSTEDGLSLATAICDYMYHKVGCRTLFATHYHELGHHIKSNYSKAICYKTDAIQDSYGNLSFIHKLVLGVAEHSFGLHVAELAGLPKDLLNDARKYKDKLKESLKIKIND